MFKFSFYLFQIGDVEGTNPCVKRFHAAVSLNIIIQCSVSVCGD